ncbi:hypothetical protein PAERUG_P18_London_17_VIM_2_04_10_00539 [Pseudomonas aeruginosa]|nr:hypothetical protein PAERUG_P18_London_17_VIM_2_04_10_00539 [Pseudomonas aeruginosa]
MACPNSAWTSASSVLPSSRSPSLRSHRRAVDVAADPAAGVPGQRAAVVGVLVFQLVEQEEAVQRAVVHLVPLQRRKGGTAVGLGRHRDRRTALAGRGLRRRLPRSAAHPRHPAMVHSLVLHGLCRGGRCGAVVHPRHPAMPHPLVVHGFRRGGGPLAVVHARHRAVVHGRVVHAIVLRGLDGIRQAQQQTQGEGTAGQAGGFRLTAHALSPSSTRTSRNMPISMWNSRWQ